MSIENIARLLTQVCIGYTAEGVVILRFAWRARKFYASFVLAEKSVEENI